MLRMVVTRTFNQVKHLRPQHVLLQRVKQASFQMNFHEPAISAEEQRQKNEVDIRRGKRRPLNKTQVILYSNV